MTASTTNLLPGSGPRTVVAGVAPGEDPNTLRIVGVRGDGSRETLATDWLRCRTRHTDDPWSVELLAWAHEDFASFEVQDGHAPSMELGKLKEIPGWLLLEFVTTKGFASFDLSKLARGGWRKGAVAWHLEGSGEIGDCGAVRWRARCWIAEPVIEFDLIWHNHNARRPVEDLRIESAVLQLAQDWAAGTPIAYPTGALHGHVLTLIGERTALLSGRHLTRRIVLAAELASIDAARVVRRLHRGTITLGEPRSFADPNPLTRAPYAPQGDRLSAWGLDVDALAAQATAELEGIEEAISAGQRLPGDVKTQNGRHGAIYTTGDDYGGSTGGGGLEVRFSPREAIVGTPDAIRLLEHRAWAQEGRGLGLIWWGGESFALPADPTTDDAPVGLPDSLRASLATDALAGINFELDPGFASWVPPGKAQGWLGGDPFGFSDLPHFTGDEPEAAHREKELRAYGWIDRQHLLRAMRYRAALASLTNDWISKVEIEALADTVRVDCWEGNGPNAELGDQWRHARAHPRRGIAPAGRQLAETARAVIEAYSLGEPGTRERWARWLNRFVEATIFAAMPSGSTRDHGWSKIAEACSPGRALTDLRGVSQSWYPALLADSLAGAQVALGGKAWAVQGAAPALEWWLVPQARAWLNYAAVADRAGDPPYKTLADVPAEARSTAPGAVSQAYDAFYHPQALAQAMLSASKSGNIKPILSAAWQLFAVSNGDVAGWLRGRKLEWLGMDMPARAVAEQVEQLDPELWRKLAQAHAAMQQVGALV